MFKTGSIVLLNNKRGIFQACIRFFSKAPYTHNAITLGYILPASESVLSAETLISVYPLQRYYDDADYEFEVYTIQGIEESDLAAIVLDMYKNRVDKGYAFLQNLWFVYRWFAELFDCDVRKQGNWFPDHDSCSEETYDLLKSVAQFTNNKRLLWKLNEWNSNCFWPADTKTVIDFFPELFIKVK